MLTSEIRINGRLVGHLYILNTQVTEGATTLYTVEYYQVGSGQTIKTKVMHRAEAGVEALVEGAMAKIRKSKKLKKLQI